MSVSLCLVVYPGNGCSLQSPMKQLNYILYVLFEKAEKDKEYFKKVIIKSYLNAGIPSPKCPVLPKGRPSAIWKTWLSRTTHSLRSLGAAIFMWSIICVCVSLLNCWHVVTQLVI